MYGFIKDHPNWATGFSIVAFVLVAISYLSDGFTQPLPDDALIRMSFLAALYLLYIDTLAGTQLARLRRSNGPRKDTLIFAFYMGYFWTMGMVLVFWSGMGDALTLVPILGLGGAFFGGVMAAFPAKDLKSYDNYDTKKSIFENSFRRHVYYAWPFVLMALIVGLLTPAASEVLAETYFLFNLVLLGSLLQPYQRKSAPTWVGTLINLWPKIAGTAFLMLGLFGHRWGLTLAL